MSVTFYVDGWSEQPKKISRKTIEEDEYDFYEATAFTEEPEKIDTNIAAFLGYKIDQVDGKYYKDVKEIIDPYPELNVSNANARSMLTAIGINCGEELIGDVDHEDISSIRQSILRITNNNKLKMHAVAPSMSRNFIDCGISEQGLADRLKRLDSVLEFAQKNKRGIYWA